MKPDALVSVIIPIYNDEEYLRESLDSAVNQTLRDIEIICVNDGSTDGTGAILREYAQKDKRLRVIEHTENKGTLMARKTGVKAACGEYMIFLDADDCLAPECCETVLELIRKEDVDFLWFTEEMLTSFDDGSSVREDHFPYPEATAGKITKPLAWVPVLDRSPLTLLRGKIYRSQLVKRAHDAMDDFYAIYGEDVYEQFFILLYADSMIGYKTKPLLTYYRERGICKETKADLDLFRRICGMSTFNRRIRSFMEREGIWEDNHIYWRNFSMRTVLDCCRELYRVPAEDYPAAKEIFLNAWDACQPWDEAIWTLAVEHASILNWTKELEQAKQWLKGQVDFKDARIAELESWAAEQDKAKEWFLGQLEQKDRRIEALEAENVKLRAALKQE